MNAETEATTIDPDWRMPPLREVSVLGRRIAYYEQGEGPALVLAHGFSGSAPFEWGRVFDLLAERHRVVAPQLIGFLPSEQADIIYSTDAQVTHLSGFLEALGLADCTLAGESYGGWLVAAYAARAAEAGSALVRPARYAILCGAVGVVRPQQSPPPAPRPPPQTPLWRAIVPRLPELNPHNEANNWARERIIAASDLRRGWPDTAALGAIATPTLLLWGEDDELVPLPYGQAAAAAIPGSQLVVLPGVGHIPSIEAPHDFVRILTDFIAGALPA
ncbi:MAG TPA: alpha/beta hydrolase [Caulobacteraceae bacterium]|jgi:pimeloyl-ACP methyl ester carboxylesterase|nr:alpha/beta hydrolase [Caulobacteraceae bacterium]